MVIVLRDNLSNEQYHELIHFLTSKGVDFQEIEAGRVINFPVTREEEDFLSALKAFPQVVDVLRTTKDYRLVKEVKIPFEAAGISWGGKLVPIIAGPCAVEDEDKYLQLAKELKEMGIQAIRGAIFKPRTSPYSFQGLGRKGIHILGRVRKELGLPVVTEILEPRQLDILYPVVDIFQIGSRNMQNYSLLKEMGRQDKPILLKRGMSATYREFLLAAEYLLYEGNNRVILCERGIRSFEDYTRNTLDLTAVPALKDLANLPVIVDPSHGTGSWSLVSPMSLAAVAAGADGLMLEVHPEPAEAFSDGCQSITPGRLKDLLVSLQKVAGAVGREMIFESEEGHHAGS